MKAILIDDETLSLDLLEQKLKEISDLEIIDKFDHFDIDQNLQLIENVDIVFLDIEMPEIDGLKMAEMLMEINPHLFIVFVTAFNEHAVEAFELNALDYLLKPVQTERLKKTIDRIKVAKSEVKTIHQNQLKVNLFRELSFVLSDESIKKIHWRTSKAQELFLYLLHHRNKTIRKDQLVDLFWTDVDLEKAYAQLYTTIYLIRKSLNIFAEHFSIKNLQNGYILETKNIVIDVVYWEEKLNSLPSITWTNAPEYEFLMEGYTGSYLQEYDYLWAENERYRLDQLWVDTAYKLARFYEEKLDFDKAEKWYKNICQFRPEEEDAHFSLMKLYAKLGYGMLVNYQYLQLKKEMEALNIEKNDEIINWYENWRNQSSKS